MSTRDKDLLIKAQNIHCHGLIIDGHNDHIESKYSKGLPLNLMKVNTRFHSDPPRLIKAGVAGTFFMVGGNDLVAAMDMIAQTLNEIDRHTQLLLIKTANDFQKAKRASKLGIMMIWEGALALNGRIDLLDISYRLGIRAICLTHGQGGQPHALQGSPSFFGYCLPADRESFRRTAKGLTDFGQKVVARMNQLGMVIDLAHINDAAFYQVLELSRQPVIASHGGVFACSPHSRCLTDDQIRALASVGGVLGIAFFHKFLTTKHANIEHVINQIAYVADLVGIDHVGLGSDFDGLPPLVRPVVPSADKLPQLTVAMLKRGFNEREIKKVLGDNFYRVLKKVI